MKSKKTKPRAKQVRIKRAQKPRPRKKTKTTTSHLSKRFFRPNFISGLRRRLLSRFRSGSNRRRKLLSWLNKIVWLSVFTFLIFFIWAITSLPSPAQLQYQPPPYSTLIYDRNGVLLYKIYATEDRIPIKLNQLPKYVPQAFIAIEDHNFYHHLGIDLKGISRALFRIVTKKRLEGGSTITQQLVKNTLLTPERTIKRKIKEVFLALGIELIYTKDEILEMYLNTVGFGGTAYGVEAASMKYFNKHAKDLSLPEAALLAGLPKAPTKYSPFGTNPALAKQRQKLVLEKMAEYGYITEDEAKTAIDQTLELAPIREDIKAPHFVMWVKDWLVNKYGEDLVNKGGLKVFTSLDYTIQQDAEKIVRQEIDKVRKYRISNGAALVTQPKTGEVLAMVGSYDFFDVKNDGQVNVSLALRQPGSSIKPLTYALALENGWTASTVLIDAPTCFLVPGQKPYCPKNYDNKFHGAVQIRFALANSYNIPAVKIMALDGLLPFLRFAQKLGLSSLQQADRYGLSLGLGGGEIKMVDMAVAYSALANYGLKTSLNPVIKIQDAKGELVYQKDNPVSRRVLSPAVSYIISHILLDNGARSAAFGPSSQLNIKGHKAVSVKTGTTNNMRDNWTIGYTQDYLTAVWVGNNDNTPMSYVASGITGATPIWNKIMTYLLKDKEDKWPAKPNDVIGRLVCVVNGQLAGDSGCQSRFEYFKKGTEPTKVSFYKKQIWVDKDTKRPPEPGQTDNLELQTHIIISDPFVKYYCLDCGGSQSYNIKLVPDQPYTTPVASPSGQPRSNQF